MPDAQTLRRHKVTLCGKTRRGVTVRLRPMTEDDWPLLYRWNSDPEVLYYSEGDDVASYSPQDVRGIFTTVSQTAFCFVIEADRVPVGECWLQEMNIERILAKHPGLDCRRIDLSIGEKSHWGQGIGTETIRLLTEFGFVEQGADVIHNCVGDYNVRSQRAFQRVGYQIAERIVEQPGRKASYEVGLAMTREEYARGRYDAAEAIRRWDMHARHLLADFDPQEGDPHRIVLLNPILTQLLPDVRGKRVLDAGCGEGYLCRKLARLGACVTGVDYSGEMLAVAAERTDPALGIRYLHGNCEHMDFLDPASFDVVVSNMVLMDLADHRAALESMHRVLVEEGILVFSICHPCFITPDCGWVRDGEGRKLHWKVDRYFAEGAYEQPVPADAQEGLILFHRTLSNYLQTLLRTGFALLDVVEPRPAEEALDRFPDFRDDLRMSHFIVFKARKQGGE